VVIGLGLLVAMFAIDARTSWVSLRRPRARQRFLGAFIRPLMVALSRHTESTQRYVREDISEFFMVNGQPPQSPAFLRLLWPDFEDYAVEIGELVEQPLNLSLADLRSLPSQTQITKHNCIQGWTSSAEWTGVPLSEIVRRCRPLHNAHHLVFRS